EVGQLARFRGLDLTAVLAQLGRNPGQAKPSVDLLLAGAAGPPSGLRVGDAVLADRELAADRRLAQGNVVRLGSGQMCEQVAEAPGIDDPQLDARPVVGDAGRLGVAPRLDLVHPVLTGKRL